jgi:hypothetical protein
MAIKTKIDKKEETTQVSAFSKEQIISSKRYKDNRDIVKVLLNDNEMYSFEEVDSLINKFMKGKVK